MAFDRPIEADSVKDFGLLSSLIRAPVVGILWLLGGENSNSKEDADEQEDKPMTMQREQLGDAVDGDASSCVEGGVGSSDGHANNSDGRSGLTVDDDHDDPSVAQDTSSVTSMTTNPTDNKENRSSSPQRPMNTSNNESKCKSRKAGPGITERPTPSPSTNDSSHYHNKPHIPDADDGTEIIDDLVAVMERSHVNIGVIAGPATNAFLTSHRILSSSSTVSLSASYSASTFSTAHPSQSINNVTLPSQSLIHDDSNPSIRGNKKMSWSDEGGHRSLVEYFDESSSSSHPPRSKHWSAMKRNGCMRESRHSFDGAERGVGAQRNDVKKIKSALKRCGSYSPPGSMYANDATRLLGDAPNSSSAESSSSSPDMKSFRSISMIGSSDSSGSTSQDTDDSMAAVTDKFANSNECVPSTLHFGCGQASGGLIIPRGGPSDPSNDSRYQLILGAGAPASRKQNAGAAAGEHDTSQNADAPAVKASVVSNPATSTTNSGPSISPGLHHHFLPRHGNGYVSPQYGFYVNITPPTPEMYAKAWDKSSKHAIQQQSYLQFQYQDKYKAPSPIPEGSYDGNDVVIPQRFVGRSSVPRPSSNRSSSQEQQGQVESTRQSSLKPTFTKNKKGMGMLLAENSHHGVWPTVPFG
ncbi:hypothetical protein ACHAWU_003903 [Discostella pseudostelligera]|uniref:Uncharacterized protein n=1 Tax=Discostella pseudostelligera TaxID=259834 RepID=A0ABD3MQ61_9STRA